MEQIYYTQCPIGYGLGASNGFQVKRITPGYPISGDFRHLGLRAFTPGGRTLAPPSLRYRRVDGSAEVASLTPRAHEYETERGPWGRPGGHFAHGLILDRAESHAVHDWPAGLFDGGFWRRSDPDPTRGRPPDPIPWPELKSTDSPDLATAARLAEGLDVGLLARLLTAVTAVMREGRTLFLIDEPDRLGPRIALLTLLFPAPARAALTFSTYHDRPEELPGYRLHGTTAAARPNRGLLLTQGYVADVAAGMIGPDVAPASWAAEVARRAASGEGPGWDGFARRHAAAEGSGGFAPWDDEWLDRLIAFGRATGRSATAVVWSEEVGLAGWAATSGAAAEWSAARGPGWWMSAEAGAGEGRTSLLDLAAWPSTWAGGLATGWGRAVGRWFADAPAPDREAAALAFARGAPDHPSRFAFVRALRQALPDAAWDGVRRRLDAAFRADPKAVALWAVPEAVAAAIAGDPGPLRDLSRTLDRLGEPPVTLLEAARIEAEDRPAAVGAALIDVFARDEAFQWGLSRGDRAIDWLRPFLRRRLAIPDDREGWRALAGSTPADLRPALARTLLAVADDPGLPDEAFLWAAEEVLLPIPEAERPVDPGWPGRYLDRSGSDLALIGRLFVRSTRTPGLRDWIEAAAKGGTLSAEHLGRLARIKALARALAAQHPGPIEAVDLGRIPGRDRGPVLARLLRRDALATADSGATLERCGLAWPGSVAAGSPDLAAIARAVADSDLLAAVADRPETWFHRLAEVRRRLDPGGPADAGFGPDGLVARVLALRAGAGGPTREAWELRSYVLDQPAAWRAVADDLRSDLLRADPTAAPAVVDSWDRAVRKRRPERFWEVALNACDGRRLAAVVAARAGDLATLGPLAWWDHPSQPGGRDDLRDAFARLAPIAPIDEESLSAVQNWMDRPAASGPPARGPRPWLSPLGLARWSCIDRLTKDVYRAGITDQARRFSIRDWPGKLPLAEIPPDDRYRLLAWVVLKLEDDSAIDHDRVGHWLVTSGLTDPDRLASWPSELGGLAEIPSRTVRAREELVRELRREMGRVIADLRAGAPADSGIRLGEAQERSQWSL